MEISEKVAYLKGLAEGLALDTDTKEGKFIAAIIDVLDDMAEKFVDLEDELCDVEDGLDAVSDDLSDVEEALYEMDEDDVIFTICTDSAVMYKTRLAELEEQQGKFTEMEAARVHSGALLHQSYQDALELGYYDRLRIHNLKYYTWVEQQGKTYEEINAQWYDRNYWTSIPPMAEQIDKLIEDFNKDVLAD